MSRAIPVASQLRRRHSPAISATLETHCGSSCSTRCSDETPYKWWYLEWHNHEFLSSLFLFLSLFIVQSICTTSVFPRSPHRFVFHALIGLRSLHLNITEFCPFDSSIVLACAPTTRGNGNDDKDEEFRETSGELRLQRDCLARVVMKEARIKSILEISTTLRQSTRDKLSIFSD